VGVCAALASSQVATSEVLMGFVSCLELSDVICFLQQHQYCGNIYPEMQNVLELQEVLT